MQLTTFMEGKGNLTSHTAIKVTESIIRNLSHTDKNIQAQMVLHTSFVKHLGRNNPNLVNVSKNGNEGKL